MDRPRPTLLALAAGVALGVACAPEGTTSAEARNVVVIVIDTLRADHLGLYGYERDTSTHLGAFAQQSIVVESSLTNAPWTKPSMGSFFTSLNPSQHGAVEESTSNRLAESLITLPEVLDDEGYEVVGFSENPHISVPRGFGQGFEHLAVRARYKGDAEWVIDNARQWFDTRDAGRPFCLYLHFLDPHGPYQPDDPAGYLDGKSTDKDNVRIGRVGRLVEEGRLLEEITPQDRDYLVALYDAEIRGIDRDVNRVFRMLEERGRLDDTIVLITSDHGEEFLDHGALLHGFWLFDETLRVPMIWRVPGLEPRRVTDTVRHIDVAPTLLDLLGLESPAQFQGRSVAALLRGESMPPVPHVAETSWRGIHRRSVRAGRWKLIVDELAGSAQLFDLEADPQESVDLSEQEPDQVRRLRELLAAETRPPAGVVVEGAEGVVDPEAEEALRSLGYFGGS